jgi:hypothetical protein
MQGFPAGEGHQDLYLYILLFPPIFEEHNIYTYKKYKYLHEIIKHKTYEYYET